MASTVQRVRLVLLHALPLDATMWANEIAWTTETQTELAAPIAPTLYGLGDSVEAWAAGVLDLVDDGPFVVVGSSVGGSCAIEVARLAPERVAALVLIGAKAAHRPEPDARDDAIRTLTRGGMTEGWPRYWAPSFGAWSDPAVVDATRKIAFAQDIDDVIRGVRAFHGRDDRSELVRQWTRPLVVVSGAHDRTPPPDAAAELAASASAGELHLVDGAGHYVSLERPERVAMILQSVLRAAHAPGR